MAQLVKTGSSRVRFQMEYLGFFIDLSLARTMALGSTQPLTEMRTRSISGGYGGECLGLTTLTHSQSGNINFRDTKRRQAFRRAEH
jgi:hypothetical protein